MAQRTQIYLSAEQRRRLDQLAAREGKSLAQIVREAVDAYLAGSTVKSEDALAATFGALPGIEVPPRSEWQRG